MAAKKTGENIIYYDSDCKLCNSLKNTIEKNDKEKVFSFIPLQLSEYKNSDSLIYVENGKKYDKSDAALKIGEKLKIWKPIIKILKFTPRPLRNAVYNFISKHRHKFQ